MDIKKTWEFLLLAYPTYRLSHCPHSRISNAASPRRDILYAKQRHFVQWRLDIIHPTQTSRCRIFLNGSNLRDLYVEDNVRKRPFFNSSRYRTRRNAAIESKMSPTNPYGPTESIAKVHINSQTANIYCFFISHITKQHIIAHITKRLAENPIHFRDFPFNA